MTGISAPLFWTCFDYSCVCVSLGGEQGNIIPPVLSARCQNRTIIMYNWWLLSKSYLKRKEKNFFRFAFKSVPGCLHYVESPQMNSGKISWHLYRMGVKEREHKLLDFSLLVK